MGFFENPFKKKAASEEDINKGAGVVGATVLVGGALAGGATGEVIKDSMPKAKERPVLIQEITAEEMGAPMQMGNGAAVELNGDQAVVTMAPRGDTDLRQPTVIDATGETGSEALARQADALERQYEDLAGRSGQVAEVIVSPGTEQTEAENKARIERALKLMSDLQGRM